MYCFLNMVFYSSYPCILFNIREADSNSAEKEICGVLVFCAGYGIHHGAISNTQIQYQNMPLKYQREVYKTYALYYQFCI